MSPSVALQRVFEAIGLGVLLPGGPGLLDPCEREPTDAAGKLTNQEREDITASAQVRSVAMEIMIFKGFDPMTCRLVGGVVKDITIGAGGLGSMPGLDKSDTDTIGSPPLRRFCFAPALNHVDGPQHSSHASA